MEICSWKYNKSWLIRYIGLLSLRQRLNKKIFGFALAPIGVAPYPTSISMVMGRFATHKIRAAGVFPECPSLGYAPKFLELYIPQQLMLYCIFKIEFSEIFNIWSSLSGNFLKNFPRFPGNFINFFKIEKKIFNFVPKLVQNHKFDQKLAKFSHKTKKQSTFA